MTTGTLILVAASTAGASIGPPSTPGVGIVILATILQGAGIPATGIALILGVDRILEQPGVARRGAGLLRGFVAEHPTLCCSSAKSLLGRLDKTVNRRSAHL